MAGQHLLNLNGDRHPFGLDITVNRSLAEDLDAVALLDGIF